MTSFSIADEIAMVQDKAMVGPEVDGTTVAVIDLDWDVTAKQLYEGLSERYAEIFEKEDGIAKDLKEDIVCYIFHRTKGN